MSWGVFLEVRPDWKVEVGLTCMARLWRNHEQQETAKLGGEKSDESRVDRFHGGDVGDAVRDERMVADPR
jgi:hypothetical protein